MESKLKIKKRIVLIKPKNIYGYSAYPPLGLLTIGTVLYENGYDVEIINAAAQRNYKELLLKKCKGVLAVGITSYTSEIKSALEITDIIKKNFKVPIIWGGWHATLFPVQTCQDGNVDFVITNEGDYSMLRLVRSLEGKNRLEDVPGIIYKKDGKIFINKSTGCLDIETLPLIKYDLVNVSDYSSTKLTDYFSRAKNVWLPYQSSRGCPHRCTFCINTVTNNNIYRKKSARKVIEEVRSFIKKYGLTHLRIIDDNFFVDCRRVKEICEGFIKNKFNITWDAECRVDYFKEGHLDDKLLSLCAKSGLIELTLGCESGSQKILDLMKKDVKVEQIVNCVTQCRKYKIIPRCSFMVGIPGESKEDIFMTARLINKLRKIEPRMAWGVATFRPYPKSEMCEDLKKKGVFREPKNLREWTTKKYVEYYTERNYKQPWQTHPELAYNMSFFYTLAGGVLLTNQQIKFNILKKINSFFIKLAEKRTEYLFFKLPIDRYFYSFFHRMYYKYDAYKRKK
ncbi:MAG: radical SAM protein [Parcubacteria group bacterium]